MDSVIRSIILLQFVICLPSLFSDCCFPGFKLRILKVALFIMMVAFLLSDFCVLEILGIGLVLLNFCLLYGKRNRDLNARRFCLSLLILALAVLGGRVVWRGVSEFGTWEDRQCSDYSQSGFCSNYGVHEEKCGNDYERRACSAYEIVVGKNIENVRMRKVNESATNVTFNFTLPDGILYEVAARKDCHEVFVKRKRLLGDSPTNSITSCFHPLASHS